ncbi:MAG: hypothetical protein D6690_13350 [Nitrospirae bacterium]|nr:MAG: hypothetical protein D6690_13350 [Nitrospirota bacterium]
MVRIRLLFIKEISMHPIPKLFIALAAALTIVQAGCGLSTVQRDAVGRFASATIHIGQLTSSEFPRLRQATIAMNAKSLALNGTANPDDLDGPLDPSVIATRLAATDALVEYGELLMALAQESTGQEELRRASDKFVSSFRRVANKTLSDRQLEGLGKLLYESGQWWLNKKKADALKALVPAVHDDVAKICDLLIQDFDLQELHIIQATQTAVNRLKVDSNIALNTPQTSYSDRWIAVDARLLAEREGARLQILSTQAIQALQTLKTANAELVQVLEDEAGPIEKIKQAVQEVKGLTQAIKAIAGR